MIPGTPTIGVLIALALLVAGCDGASSDTAKEQVADAEQAVAAGDFNAAVVHLKNAVQAAPENADYRLRLGLAYLELRDAAAAEKELRRARELGAPTGEVSVPLLRAWLMIGRNTDAIALAQDLREPPLVKVLEARAHVAAGNLEEAEILLRNADAGVDAELARADLALARQAVDEAIAAADRALAKDAGLYPAMLVKARALLGMQEYDAVVAVLEGAEGHARNDLNVHILRVLALHGKKDFAAATRALQPLRTKAPTAPATRYLSAMIALSERDYEGAKDAAETVLGDVPNHTGALLIGGAANAALGYPDTARTQLQRLLALQPDDERARHLLTMLDSSGGSKVATTTPTDGDAPVDAGPNTILRNLSTKALDKLRSGDADEALKIAEEMANGYPESSAGPNIMGLIQVRRGDLGGARAAFEEAITREPDDASAITNLAEFHRSQGDLATAREVLMKGLESVPEHPKVLVALSRIELENGKLESGEEYLKRAVAVSGASPDAAIALGRYYLARRQAEQALETARSGLEKSPESQQLMEVLAIAQTAMDRHVEAAETYVRVAEASGNQQFRLRAARAYANAGDSEKVVQTYEAALVADPSLNDVRIAVTDLLIRMGKSEAAEKHLAVLGERMSDSVQTTLLRGYHAVLEQNYDAAIEHFSEAQAKEPTQRATILLARAHWAIGDRQKAVAALDAWLENNPDDQQVLVERANFHISMNRLSEAETAYEKVIASQPNNAVVLNNLAWVDFKLGQMDEAWSRVQRARELAPNAPAVLDTYGEIALARGEIEAAVEASGRAHSANPDNPDYGLRHAKALVAAERKGDARALLEKLAENFGESTEVGRDIRAALQGL